MLCAGCLLLAVFSDAPALAQTYPPDMPNLPPGFKIPKGYENRARRRKAKNDAQNSAPGVPVPLDAPPIKAFRQLEQQSVYHMRFTISADNPQVAEMMAQMGFAPTETTVMGNTKLVSMRMNLRSSDTGQADPWEFIGVSREGRVARKMISPAIPRLLAKDDAQFAKQMAEYNAMAARSIAQSAAQGPFGWISAGITAASMALSDVMATRMLHKAHEFFEWQCMDNPNYRPVDRTVPPPMTDLRDAGDQSIDGVAVKSYEFFVTENGQSHGPLRMHVTRDTGLPVRIEMNDPRMGGGMRIDYFDFNQGGFDLPACMGGEK